MSSTAHKLPDVDFKQLAAQLDPRQLVPQWLPDGKQQGNEWIARNPTRQDKRPGSFSVSLVTGKWSDFATGDSGNDLISLWAYLHHHGKQLNAARDLMERYHLNTPCSDYRPPAPVAVPNNDQLIMPVPDGIPAPTPQQLEHSRHGIPLKRWAYNNEAGKLLFYVCRFEPHGERKQIIPMTYRHDSKGTGWRWKGIAGDTPRPLYGLDRLAARPDAPVLIVEGEKAADAAQKLLPDVVAITWMGGTAATLKADWNPLKDRRVIIWPDHDEPGRKAARELTQHLTAIASELAQISPPEGKPEGWDAADATGEEAKQLLNEAKATAPAPALPYGFKRQQGGIWYQDPADEQGREYWVCSDLEITASTRDQRNENHGYLLEFKDTDQHHHNWAMPAELLAGSGDEYRRVLLSKGLTIAPGPKARQLLAQYIQTCRPTTRARCVGMTGWHSGAYVLPDKVLGNSADRLLLQTTSGDVAGYDTTGTLESWRNEVSRYCQGNSRLLLSVSAALAAPMLALIHAEGGGFHLRGYSSTGKTTALAVAASVWGPPERIRRWRSTGNGLEGTAALHNDALLCLDELAELPAKDAGSVAYMLANGQGKARATRSGELRQPARWRTLFMSTGEISLSDHIRSAGERAYAGQEVRVIDLAADAGAGYGLFDTIHGQPGGEHLSRLLVENAKHHHGTAARAFIERLANERQTVTEWTDGTRKHFSGKVIPSDADGQVKRVADRFAIVAAAGELATHWGITGWDKGEAAKAAKRCFSDWLENRGGSGSQEDCQALDQVRAFLQQHGSSRFAHTENDLVHNRAGYIRTHNGEHQYLLFPEVFRKEVCKGMDPQRTARLLAELGHLQKDNTRLTSKVNLPNHTRPRMYIIRASIIDEA